MTSALISFLEAQYLLVVKVYLRYCILRAAIKECCTCRLNNRLDYAIAVFVEVSIIVVVAAAVSARSLLATMWCHEKHQKHPSSPLPLATPILVLICS